MNKIAALNDAFRTTLSGGTVLLSVGVQELPDMVKAAAIRKVATFNDFNEDNDPHGEHDFGTFRLCGRRFWSQERKRRTYRQPSADDHACPRVVT